jgi:hypothetical protein
MRVGNVLTSLLVFALVQLIAGQAAADIPRRINYQGRLTDAAGAPLPGNHTLFFSLHDMESGGIMLWSETQIATADSDGVFSTILGSNTPIQISFSEPRWLSITVDGQPLSPRREIVAVPSALDAAKAANCDSLDGLGPDSYSLVGHDHDSRYFTESEMTSGSIINTPSNPVDWTKLKNVPDGLADGTDDVGGAGDGYSLEADDGYPINVVYVDATGEVGVGTTNPTTNLHVKAGSAGAVTLSNDADVVIEDDHAALINFQTPSSYAGGLVFGDPDESASGWVLYDNNTHVLRLGTAGDNRIAIRSDGAIGVGVLNPEASLHIAKASADLVGVKIENVSTSSNSSEGVTFSDENGDLAGIATYDDGSTYSNAMRIYNSRTNGTIRLENGGLERMRIANGGNVGIGTTSPPYRLSLHVASADMSYVQTTNGTTGSGIDDGLRVGVNGGGQAFVFNEENTSLQFGTNNAIRVTLAADGKLGIGTSSPTATLDVYNSTGYGQMRIRTTYTPSGTDDAHGSIGDVTWDNSHVYIKTAAGWKRATLSTF